MPAISTHDPYKNFKFRVKWDGQYIAGISKMSALKSVTEVVVMHEGGDPHEIRLPGRTKFEPITLERGITTDQAFNAWAALVWTGGASVSPGTANFRKDLIIELRHKSGKPVAAYKVYRCWVSEYVALPDLDTDANAVAIEHITLENEGWERDDSLIEPTP
jgi:phage tail-like protein